jgi:hypothetical protein
MPDLSKMWSRVSLETNVRTVHKLYAALHVTGNGAIVSPEDDGNLRAFCKICEVILEKSGYMTPREILAIKQAYHGAIEVKR